MPDRWDESFELGEFLHYCTYALRSVLLLRTGKDSCILTTKLLCDLLREHGIKTMPVTFQVTAMNEEAWEDARQGRPVRLHTDPHDPHYAVQVKHQDKLDEGLLHGHLALIAANEWLVDGSIDQLSRPVRGIHIMPLIAKLPFPLYDLLNGEQMALDLPEGGGLVYEPHAEDLNYLAGPDFHALDPEDSWDAMLMDAAAEATELVRLAVETGKFPTLPRMPENVTGTAVQVAAQAKGMSYPEAQEMFMRHGFTMEGFSDTVREARRNAEKLSERLRD